MTHAVLDHPSSVIADPIAHGVPGGRSRPADLTVAPGVAAETAASAAAPAAETVALRGDARDTVVGRGATAAPASVPVQAPSLRVAETRLDDPLARPLIDGLTQEYVLRYGPLYAGRDQDLARYPAAEFAGPAGGLLLWLDGDRAVAGGGFRQHRFEDPLTVEFRRIWVAPAYRGTGLGRVVLRELEGRAVGRGYIRAHAGAGSRQPEMRGLLVATGYRAALRGGQILPAGAGAGAGAGARAGGADGRAVPAGHPATSGAFEKALAAV